MRALEGLKVVALEQAVAAPLCTARLADAGADVLKIERAEGDFARGYDRAASGQSSYFVWLNRGKRSRVLDLAGAAGRAELANLIAGADVLVQNLRPGALARMGLAVETLRARHPRLVTCSISGYGEAGAMAERKAYDLLIQAESGLASVTGSPDAASRVGISIADIATGATAYAAILEALIRRGITGEGAAISVSMFDVMAEWLTVPLLQHEGGQSPSHVGLAHPSIAPYGVFACADGTPLLVAIQNDREWTAFADRVLGDPALAADPRFAGNVARVAHRAETDARVAAALGAMTVSEAELALDAAGTAFARVNDMAGLSTHPELRRITVATPHGPVALPAPAPLVDGTARDDYGRVPAIGEE